MSNLFVTASSVRFSDWYSDYGAVFHNTSTQTCNETLTEYMADYRNSPSPTCDLHLDCVLGASSESLKAKMASAAIFLGILPSMLSMLGPSMTQLAILSARRPLLSLLISLGAGGFYLDRLFRLETPAEILYLAQGERLIPHINSSRVGILVGLLEYVLAAAAVLNTVNLAVRIGDRTIMSFACNLWFLPLIWVLSLLFIFLLVAGPFQFSELAKHVRRCTGSKPPKHHAIDTSPEGDGVMHWVPLHDRTELSPPRERHVRQNNAAKFVLREVTSGLTHPSLVIHEIPEFESWVAVLFNVGCFLVAFHIILGTCWFSSIIFLAPRDAIKIIMRFFGSAIVCRLIIMIELASMKSREIPRSDE
jgi:hypothetical protein